MLRLAPYSRQTVLWKRSSSSGRQKCNNQRTGKRWQAGKNFVMGGRLFSGIRTVFRKLCGHKSHTTAGKYVSTHGHQCNRYGQKSNRGGQVAPLQVLLLLDLPHTSIFTKISPFVCHLVYCSYFVTRQASGQMYSTSVLPA